jgi:hypothetical protein
MVNINNFFAISKMEWHHKMLLDRLTVSDIAYSILALRMVYGWRKPSRKRRCVRLKKRRKPSNFKCVTVNKYHDVQRRT